MRAVVCDQCGKVITGAIYPYLFGKNRKDACSPECLKVLVEKVPA